MRSLARIRAWLAGRGRQWSPWSLRRQLQQQQFRARMAELAIQGRVRCPDCAMEYLYHSLYPTEPPSPQATPPQEGQDGS